MATQKKWILGIGRRTSARFYWVLYLGLLLALLMPVGILALYILEELFGEGMRVRGVIIGTVLGSIVVPFTTPLFKGLKARHLAGDQLSWERARQIGKDWMKIKEPEEGEPVTYSGHVASKYLDHLIQKAISETKGYQEPTNVLLELKRSKLAPHQALADFATIYDAKVYLLPGYVDKYEIVFYDKSSQEQLVVGFNDHGVGPVWFQYDYLFRHDKMPPDAKCTAVLKAILDGKYEYKVKSPLPFTKRLHCVVTVDGQEIEAKGKKMIKSLEQVPNKPTFKKT